MILRKITIIMMVANAAGAFLIAAGAPAVWGMSPETGIEGTTDAVNESASEITTERGGSGDLFGIVSGAISTARQIAQLPFAAPLLLLNLGVPEFIVSFIFAPLYVVVSLDMISLMRGGTI